MMIKWNVCNSAFVIMLLEKLMRFLFFITRKISDHSELKWKPKNDQLDRIILSAYKLIEKQSVVYLNKFKYPQQYFADMLWYRRCFNFNSSKMRIWTVWRLVQQPKVIHKTSYPFIIDCEYHKYLLIKSAPV